MNTFWNLILWYSLKGVNAEGIVRLKKCRNTFFGVPQKTVQGCLEVDDDQ